MKILRFAKNNWIISFIAFILLLVLLNFAGYIFNIKYISVVKAVSEVNKYEVRAELLMQATDYVGVCRPEDAVKVWSEGLMKRSAAMQYSVMGSKLKQEYAKQLDTSFPNWVTGMSSPWISGYEIKKSEQIDDSFIYYLVISTATSTGPAANYNAVLTVIKEYDFWRIINIKTDKELYPYTGYQP
ncbi:MAG: hypothetical protein GYA50_07245 [Eubacteriaceae bacterium]|nr:hypothetical protein [Eubacteriaceae bacterium]